MIIEDALLKVSDLNVNIGKKQILYNINLLLNKGEILSIVGESGSGKTTLIRAVSGLLSKSGEIYSGEVFFDNKILSNQDMNNIRGKEIAYVFQNPASYLDPIKKIRKQYISCIRRHINLSKKEVEKRAIETLNCMKFDNPETVLNSYPHQLSGGMNQRVAFAMALSLEPKLIIADEPTSALDVITQRQILKQITELRDRNNTSFIIVTHNLNCAFEISDNILVMKAGNIVEYGTAYEIRNNPKSEYTKKLIKSIPVMRGDYDGQCRVI